MDFTKLFDNGLAIGIIVVIALFLYFKYWPWYVGRMAAQDKYQLEREQKQDAERSERHNEYMLNQRNQTEALNRLGDITEQFALTLTRLDDKMSSNHAELLARLEKLKTRDTGPLGKVDQQKVKDMQ